jgi:antitoxin component YwqK of YwqJK toxin-antitoxin module
MPDDFDPYYKWLGIPPKDQPLNYYRLLGIELFESDPDTIKQAARGRLEQVRAYQKGQYAVISQKIQKKISAAEACLLNPEKKNEYDISLKLQLRSQSAQALPKAKPMGDYGAAPSPPPSPGSTSRQFPGSPPAVQKIPVQGGRSDNTSSLGAVLVAVKESFDLLLRFMRRHKSTSSLVAKSLGLALVAVIILLIFAHGKELWTYTFDKTSNLVAKITGSSAERPPDLQSRIRTIPKGKPGSPANSDNRPQNAIPPPPGTEEPSNAAAAPPAGGESVAAPGAPENASASSGTQPAAQPQANTPRPEQATEIIVLTLPSGKTFNSRLFKINVTPILELLKDTAKEEQVLFLENPVGRLCAFAEYKLNNLNGLFVSYSENRQPMTYAVYSDGSPDGIFKTWNEKGQRVYWCQYAKGVSNGFCCYFKDNYLRLLLEMDNDEIKNVHLCSNGKLEKSFASIAEASADTDAKTLLEELDDLKSDLKTNENYFKKVAREEYASIRRDRKATASSIKRAALQERLNQYAAERQAVVQSFWQYKGW